MKQQSGTAPGKREVMPPKSAPVKMTENPKPKIIPDKPAVKDKPPSKAKEEKKDKPDDDKKVEDLKKPQ